MRRGRGLCAALALLLALSAGCAAGQEEPSDYQLYFAVSRSTASGPALDTEPYDRDSCTRTHPQGESCPSPGDLVEALLAGPQGEELRTPFPREDTLQSWNWDPEMEGNLQIYLSEQYGGLTDISLTLADYSIVLTLAQLEGVESVEIISEGHTANYRSHQILRPEEVLLPAGAEEADSSA